MATKKKGESKEPAAGTGKKKAPPVKKPARNGIKGAKTGIKSPDPKNPPAPPVPEKPELSEKPEKDLPFELTETNSTPPAA